MFLKNFPIEPLGSFISFSRFFAILLVLTALSISNTKAGVIPGENESNNSSTNPICGKVITSAGKILTLREGVSLTDSEFKSVQVGKLHGAQFLPISEGSRCAINVCGFTSWGIQYDENYIGTNGDYSGCKFIVKATKANKPIYNDRFNTSSLSCGCTKSEQDCFYKSCNLRASKLTWADNDCATLFQEQYCNSCYLPPVTMSNGSTISTGHSIQFYTAVVREDCYLEQRSDAFARMWRFQNVKQPIVYKGGWSGNLMSAYQSDPDKFSCFCGLPTPPTLPTTYTSVTDKRGKSSLPPVTQSTNKPVDEGALLKVPQAASGEAVVFIGGAVLILAFALAVYLSWKKLPRPCGKVTTPVVNLDQQEEEQNKDDHDFITVTNEFNKVCSIGNSVARDAFNIATKDLENPLGQGRIGIVYRASLKNEHDDGLAEAIAVKKVEWSGAPKSVVRSYIREIKTFQKIFINGDNENIIKFFGACCSQDGLFILTELCETSLEKHLWKTMRPRILNTQPPPVEMIEGVDSYYHTDNKAEMQWLEKIKNPSLTPDEFHQLILWCKQIACGMEHLSSNGLIHSDLALRNVLLKGGIAKICDFGLSMEYFGQSVLTGDFPYNSFAPEFNTEVSNSPDKLTTHVDVWAYGFVLWEVFTLGDPLYPTVKEKGNFRFKEVSRLLKQGYRHPKPPLANDDVYEKMLECWQNVPEDRPNFTDLRAFFSNLAPT